MSQVAVATFFSISTKYLVIHFIFKKNKQNTFEQLINQSFFPKLMPVCIDKTQRDYL